MSVVIDWLARWNKVEIYVLTRWSNVVACARTKGTCNPQTLSFNEFHNDFSEKRFIPRKKWWFATFYGCDLHYYLRITLKLFAVQFHDKKSFEKKTNEFIKDKHWNCGPYLCGLVSVFFEEKRFLPIAILMNWFIDLIKTICMKMKFIGIKLKCVLVWRRVAHTTIVYIVWLLFCAATCVCLSMSI